MSADYRPQALCLGEGDLSLATDLYQLTMAAVYHGRRPPAGATFELFVRRLPARRNFLVFAGLEQALASLRALRFSGEQLDYLRRLPQFGGVEPSFFDELAGFRFRGEVWAMREGSVSFPGEPVLRVTGSLLEAQLVETVLLSIVNFQTAIASKAARIRLAAGDAQLAEFGGRRAHGPQAATWVARAAWLAGFDSTSNVLAGQRLGVPVVGTMAHSFVMSYGGEREAFARFAERFPEHSILLVDTYDSLDGVRKAIELGPRLKGVRLDSGDLAALAFEARRLLDAAGLTETRVFASGDLDENRITELRAAGAPIDAFGVGTRLATSSDTPYVGGIYKLVEVEENGRAVPRFKDSPGKTTYPGKKQVERRLSGGRMTADRVLAHGAAGGDGEPLLEQVMRDGEPVAARGLSEARRHCRRELTRLPEELATLAPPPRAYPVQIDRSLERLLERERSRVAAQSPSQGSG